MRRLRPVATVGLETRKRHVWQSTSWSVCILVHTVFSHCKVQVGGVPTKARPANGDFSKHRVSGRDDDSSQWCSFLMLRAVMGPLRKSLGPVFLPETHFSLTSCLLPAALVTRSRTQPT